jgi:hypothetical protein
MSFVNRHSPPAPISSSVFRVQTNNCQTPSKSGLQTVELSSVSQTPFHHPPENHPDSIQTGKSIGGKPSPRLAVFLIIMIYPRREGRMASDSSNTGG